MVYITKLSYLDDAHIGVGYFVEVEINKSITETLFY